MSQEAQGNLLRIARQLRGFRQGEAANKLGVKSSILSRIENGALNASDAMIDRASKEFRLPSSFFDLNDTVYGAPVSVHPMYRKKASITSREMDQIIAELNIRIMHLRRLLEAAELQPERDIPRFNIEEYGDDPELIAGKVRAFWQVPQGPLHNLTQLLEQAGILIVHSPLGGATVSGVTISVPGIPPLIVLNADQTADRMRFTLAHELGHIVMHRFPTPDMEKEANEFASTLLMPRYEVMAALRRKRKVDLALLASLKPEWKVSMQGLLYTANSLGLLTPNQNRYLWQQFNIRKIKMREPPELDFPVEQPSSTKELFHLHFKELNYSLEELGEILHMWPDELSKIYGLDDRKSDQVSSSLRVVK